MTFLHRTSFATYVYEKKGGVKRQLPKYGNEIQRVLIERFRLVAVVWSEVEPFFAHAEINTIIIVAEARQDDRKPRPGELIRFATLQRPIAEIVGG